MSRLNRVVMKQFKTALDQSSFTLSDFDVSFPDSGKVYARATFVPNPQYIFQLCSHDGIYTTETPGDNYWTEDNKCYGVSNGIERIATWTKNVKADMRAGIPLDDEFDQLRKELQETLEDHAESLEGYFTREESDALQAKFDSLLKRFEELRKEKAITDQQIAEIRRDISELKENATSFPKRVFFKTAGNKLLNICKKVRGSQTVKTLGMETAKEVIKLGLEGKLQLPHS